MTEGAKKYFDRIKNTIEWLETEQWDNILQASQELTEAITAKRTVWAFGCTHSAILTAEVFYRAGGLMVFNGIFPSGLWLDEIPPTKTSKTENLPEYGRVIFQEHNIQAEDLVFLFSTSGRNKVPVEFALEASRQEVKLIAITSLEYSKSVASRHESGKKIYEIADIVIDNGADKGDASVEFDGFDQKVGPISTVSGATILNAIVCETVGKLLERGEDPPVFKSGNLDGGQAYNKKMLDNLQGMIKYMPY